MEVLAESLRLFFADGALAVDCVGDSAPRAKDGDQLSLTLTRLLQQCLQQLPFSAAARPPLSHALVPRHWL